VALALALDNAVVIKPASDTPITGGLVLGRIFEEAGLPAGMLNVVIGPTINKSQLKGVQQKIAKAKEQGAKVLLEGEIHEQMVPPYVFDDVTPDMQFSTDEIFGPIGGIQKARDEHHALELANGTEFSLSSSVFSGDLNRGLRFARKVQV
jgi:aldehyde dehydrogenase (NAD+)